MITTPRWMLYVDGENIAARASEVAASNGLMLSEGAYYKPRCFAWIPGDLFHCKRLTFAPMNAPQLLAAAERAYYFTGVTGSAQEIESVERALDAIGFDARVYQRPKGRSTKRVDVALTVAMLSDAFNNTFDAAVLATGDEDFIPLVEAVKGRGKQVYGWAFGGPGSGLSQDLCRRFDRFFDMTDEFCEMCQNGHGSRWPDTTNRLRLTMDGPSVPSRNVTA